MSDFARRYLAAIDLILGETPPPVPESALLVREQLCGAPVPLALHEFHRVACSAYDRLWDHCRFTGVRRDVLPVDEIRLEGGVLVFQRGFDTMYGVEQRRLFLDDPQVAWSPTVNVALLKNALHGRALAERALANFVPEWHGSSRTVSMHLEEALYFLATHGGMKHQRYAAINDEVEARIARAYPTVYERTNCRVYARAGQILMVQQHGYAQVQAPLPGRHCLSIGGRTNSDWQAMQLLSIDWLERLG